MTDYRRKRISIHNVALDMELADDAITPSGMLLVPKDTIITDQHIFRMNLYQILSVVIKECNPIDFIPDLNDFTEIEEVIESTTNSEPKSENFLRFKSVFTKVESSVRTQLQDLAKGLPIEPLKLIANTEALIGSLRLKSELFTYMTHLKSSNSHTYVHSINVSMLCHLFGHWLKLPPDDIHDLVLAGLIHDIGKTQIDESILDKPGRLTSKEFEEIKQHATIGYNIIESQDISDQVKQAILLHHERCDGSGYPRGLKSDDIPDFAKIIAILDIYDAMTSSRSYHHKFSPFKVIQMFEQESYGYLDTKFLFIFLENIAHNYLGETAILSDGREAKIVFIHNNSPSRPIVQIGYEMIDLLNVTNLTIEEIC